MPGPRVLVIGCGIAGPVLALLLQKKGYTVVILEKVPLLGDAGASMMLFPNGLKVLDLVGLATAATDLSPHAVYMKDFTFKGDYIGGSTLPTTWPGLYSQPACGSKRASLNLLLADAVRRAGIELKEAWKLEGIEETDRGITATNSKGESESGAFLVGCDGIKSVARKLLLEQRGISEGDAHFTGLTQTAGFSPTPATLFGKEPGLYNFYGPGRHMIAYPVSSETTSWAITTRSTSENPETWQQMSTNELLTVKQSLIEEFKDWTPLASNLITGAERIIKYGLYDREHIEPSQWVSRGSSAVLIGDAAHPTSPHLGQGANQALEDAWFLCHLLPDVKEGKELSREVLGKAFEKLAEARQPRTKELVRGARAAGERRVVDAEGQETRNTELKAMWQDEKALATRWDSLLSGPFRV